MANIAIPSNWTKLEPVDVKVKNGEVTRTIYKQPKTFCLAITRIAQFILGILSACLLFPLFSRTVRNYICIFRKTETIFIDVPKVVSSPNQLSSGSPHGSTSLSQQSPHSEEERGGEDSIIAGALDIATNQIDLTLSGKRLSNYPPFHSPLSPILPTDSDSTPRHENRGETKARRCLAQELQICARTTENERVAGLDSPNAEGAPEKTNLVNPEARTENSAIALAQVLGVTTGPEPTEVEVINSAIGNWIYKASREELQAAFDINTLNESNVLFSIPLIQSNLKINYNYQLNDLKEFEIYSFQDDKKFWEGCPEIFNIFFRRAIYLGLDIPLQVLDQSPVKEFMKERTVIKEDHRQIEYTQDALIRDAMVDVALLTKTKFKKALEEKGAGELLRLDIMPKNSYALCIGNINEIVKKGVFKDQVREVKGTFYLKQLSKKGIKLQSRSSEFKIGEKRIEGAFIDIEKDSKLFNAFAAALTHKVQTPALESTFKTLPKNDILKWIVNNVEKTLQNNPLGKFLFSMGDIYTGNTP